MPVDPEIERIMQRKLQEMLDGRDAVRDDSARARPAKSVMDLDSLTFSKTISDPSPTLVDFWAEWCGPCKAMHPVFESLNAIYQNIRFARINVDACPDVAARFGVQSIPTFIMFRAGTIVDRMMGAVGAEGIHTICKRHSV